MVKLWIEWWFQPTHLKNMLIKLEITLYLYTFPFFVVIFSKKKVCFWFLRPKISKFIFLKSFEGDSSTKKSKKNLRLYGWWFRNPAKQLRLVAYHVYPIIYRGLAPSQVVFSPGQLKKTHTTKQRSTIGLELAGAWCLNTTWPCSPPGNVFIKSSFGPPI